MTETYVHTVAVMGTVVTIQVAHGASRREQTGREASVQRAVDWFRQIELSCSRFDARSEVRQLSARVGSPVAVSDMLFECVRFALAVAEESDGAFDPTVGLVQEARGFNREYQSGDIIRTDLASAGAVSHRDVHLDDDQKTITLLRPLLLDLGAVAKGLAIDMAARELAAIGDFAIDAGGDLYFGGCNAEGNAWSVGIRHPRDERELVDTIRVSDMAVCTSGDYERRADDGGHHIVDPRTGRSTNSVASVTVIATSAMVADALATAAFVLGPTAGLDLLARHGVAGLILTPELERFATPAMRENHEFARTHNA